MRNTKDEKIEELNGKVGELISYFKLKADNGYRVHVRPVAICNEEHNSPRLRVMRRCAKGGANIFDDEAQKKEMQVLKNQDSWLLVSAMDGKLLFLQKKDLTPRWTNATGKDEAKRRALPASLDAEALVGAARKLQNTEFLTTGNRAATISIVFGVPVPTQKETLYDQNKWGKEEQPVTRRRVGDRWEITRSPSIKCFARTICHPTCSST